MKLTMSTRKSGIKFRTLAWGNKNEGCSAKKTRNMHVAKSFAKCNQEYMYVQDGSDISEIIKRFIKMTQHS
jgi:hypothetical protein